MSLEMSLGGDGARIVLTVRGFENPRAPDPDDAKWLDCQVTFGTAGVQAAVAGSLMITEIQEFVRELDAATRLLDGGALLDSMEGWLRIEVSLRRTGHAAVSAQLVEAGNARATLKLDFQSDQTFTRAAVAEWARVVQDLSRSSDAR